MYTEYKYGGVLGELAFGHRDRVKPTAAVDRRAVSDGKCEC